MTATTPTQLLCFSNPGEIDIRAATVLGVNVKPGDNPIGHFGTGLKYVIAGVLRLGGEITIWSGETKYQFGAMENIIRNAPFNIIHMWTSEHEQQNLGFTTALGKDWEPWMLVRELLSNCKDEDGLHGVVSNYIPQLETTGILINCEPLAQAYWSRGTFWIEEDEAPLWKDERIAVYPGSASAIYYHGIRATPKSQDETWSFRYSLLGQMQLTEDRTFADMYSVRQEIGKALLSCTDRGMLEIVLNTEAEGKLDYHWNSVRPSEEFVQVVLSRLEQKLEVPSSAREMVRGHRPKEVEKAELDIPQDWQEMLRRKPEDAPEVTANYYTWMSEMEERGKALEALAKYWQGCAEELAQQLEEAEQRLSVLAPHEDTSLYEVPEVLPCEQQSEAEVVVEASSEEEA